MGGADLWPSLFEDGRNWSADIRGLPFSMYAPRGGGGGAVKSLIHISIAYFMQNEGKGVQIACKIAYVLNGRPLSVKDNAPHRGTSFSAHSLYGTEGKKSVH